MAITDWKEAAAAATLIAGKRGSHEWTAPYILTSDNPRDDALTCVEYMTSINRGIYSVFRYGDTVDTSVCCNTIAPVRMQGSVEHWLVTLTYGPPVPITSEPPAVGVDEDGNPSDDPTVWRHEISIANASFQVPVEKAWNVDEMPPSAIPGSGGYVRPANTLGPVHNSAGIVYDPPLMRDITEIILRVTGYSTDFDTGAAFGFTNSINDSSVRWSDRMKSKYDFKHASFGKYCVLCSGYSAVYSYASWRTTVEVRIRTAADALNPQDGFLETVLDQGYSRKANVGDPDGRGSTYTSGDLEEGMGIHAAIRDMDGERTPERVMLDGHGQPLQSTSTWTQPPVYFRWRVHKTAYFPALPLEIFEPL